MDLGCSDIIKGIELAYAIYQIAFTYENRADVRYDNFRKEVEGLRDEVRSFEHLLKQLQASLNGAEGRFNGRTFSNRAARALSPFQPDFDTERRKIIGNFNATLEECQRLLEENRALSRRGSNAFVNGAWHFQTQPKVDQLRKRIHLHTTKVLLVIDRLSFDLLTDLDARFDELVALSEQNLSTSKETLGLVRQLLYGDRVPHSAHQSANLPQDEHFASPPIAQRFESHLLRSDTLTVATDIPLVEGFDTLMLHYNQLLNEPDGSKESYLGLLKVRWMIGILKASNQFDCARPGFYYKRAINQVEQAISLHVREARLIGYDEDSLIALPDMSFYIWPLVQESTSSLQDPMNPRANEVEAIRLQLGANGSQTQTNLVVFQQSDTKFRIALEEISAHHGRIISALTMHANQDRLIPRYALPTVNSACFEMAVFSCLEEEERSYQFRSEEDLFGFQKALTGYDVRHDQPNIRCEFSKDCKIDCDGRVQLWQDPVDLATNADHHNQSSSLGSSPGSNSTSDVRSRHNSIAASVSPSSVHYLDEGLEAGAVKLPAIMIYTSMKRRGTTSFTMIFFELDGSIRIIPERCKCATEYQTCPYIVLERSKGSRIPVRVAFSQANGAGVPDPNTFNLLPFRLPRPAQYRDLRVKESAYVLFKFKTLEAKKKFHHELNLRIRVRDAQRRRQEDTIRRLANRENRPTRNINQPGSQTSPQRRPSYFDDELPQIAMPQLDTTLEMQEFKF